MPLHCPTRFFIARHGDAGYAHAHVMSDDGGWLTGKGREQVQSCAAALTADRIAAVHTSPLDRAVQSGEIAAPILSVAVEVAPGLAEISVGDCAGKPWGDPSLQSVYDAWMAGDLHARVPGGETGAEVIARFRDAVESIADRYRGEQVLLFSHGGVMSFAIPRLAANTADDLAHRKFIPNAVPAVVEVGDEGWRVLSWPGSADAASV